LRFSAKKHSPAGGLRLPAGKHEIILTEIQTIVNKKLAKMDFFWSSPRSLCIRKRVAGI
jgi:hypothetical protein